MKLYNNPRPRASIDLDEMKRLRAQGYTIGQLAEHFGVSQTSITNRLRREGLTLAGITPKDVNILPGRRIHHFDLEEVKRLRAMGYGATRIARELGVPVSRIYSRLQTAGLTIADITPEGVEAKRYSEENRYRTNIDIEELKRLRAQGYTIGQLAEHFGVSKTAITNRLSNVGLTLDGITPKDVSILPGKRIHHFDLEEVKRLRAMGYGATRIARELGVPVGRIYSRLKTAGLTIADITPEGVRVARYGPKKDFPRDNPLQAQGSAMSKTVGFGVGATATTALDYTLKKTTELSSTKRHLISGGATTVVGLGVYATTKREDALWSAYGSIFATVGHLIYNKLQK